jgi:hypothetical protein
MRKIFNASSQLLHICPLWLEQRIDCTRERRAGALNRKEPCHQNRENVHETEDNRMAVDHPGKYIAHGIAGW